MLRQLRNFPNLTASLMTLWLVPRATLKPTSSSSPCRALSPICLPPLLPVKHSNPEPKHAPKSL
ncbi:hypothetical protein BDD12DRAFT_814610 [Trichophaea hybrida]|nr:hypothetical protein BDD12DRAFT_814610 [Trichophaea hybrida]